MLYILDHYYATNHKDFCELIESNKTYEEIAEIAIALEFLFEDTVSENKSLSMDSLIEIFCDFYGAKKVCKDDFKETINWIIDTEEEIDFTSGEKYRDNNLFTYIELYDEREKHCGPKYEKLYDKWLPNNENLNRIKEMLKAEK